MSNILHIEGTPYHPAPIAAKQLGYTKEYLLMLAKQGKIDGRKHGNKWYINVPSAERFFKEATDERKDRRRTISLERKRELQAHAADRAARKRRQERIARRSVAIFETLVVLILGLTVGLGGYAGVQTGQRASVSSVPEFIDSFSLWLYRSVMPEHESTRIAQGSSEPPAEHVVDDVAAEDDAALPPTLVASQALASQSIVIQGGGYAYNNTLTELISIVSGLTRIVGASLVSPQDPVFVHKQADAIYDSLNDAVDDFNDSIGDTNDDLSELTADVEDLGADLAALSAFVATSSFAQGGNAFGTTALLGTTDGHPLSLVTNGIEQLTVTADGNIGIGTTTPDKDFYLWRNEDTLTRLIVENENSGSNASASLYASSDIGDIRLESFSSGNTNLGLGGITLGGYGRIRTESALNGLMIEAGGNKPIIFGNSTERMRIATGGNIGIGTTTPPHTLSVEGDAYFTGGLGVGVATTTAGVLQTAGDAHIGGNLTVIGDSTVFGASAADSLIINSSIKSDLVPDQNVTYDLGSPSFYWDRAYIGTLNVNNIAAANTTISGTQNESFVINSDNASADTEDAVLTFFRGAVVPNALITWNSTLDRFEFNQPTYIENAAGSVASTTLTLQGVVGQTAGILSIASSTGDEIFAVGPDGSITTSGNVGIGTSTPGRALTLVGNQDIHAANTHLRLLDTDVTGYSYIERNGTRTNFGNNNGTSSAINMVIHDSGNVGIGTTAPGERLDVVGNILSRSSASTGALYLGNSSHGIQRRSDGSTRDIEIFTDGADSSFFVSTNGAGSKEFTILDSGNVGIGTASPSNRLHVVSAGNSTIPFGVYADDGSYLSYVSQTSAGAGRFTVTNASGASSIVLDGGGGNSYINTGNFGIGTQSPTIGRLQINQTTDSSSGGVAIVNVSSTGSGRLYTTSSNAFVINAASTGGGTLVLNEGGGNVGIGTSNPSTRLHVDSTSAGSDVALLTLSNTSNTAGTGATLRFAPTSDPSIRYAAISGLSPSGSNNVDLAFITGAGSVITEKMRITNSGNVGVGTSTPEAKFHIALPSGDADALALTRDNGSDSLLLRLASYTSGDTGRGLELFNTTDNTSLAFFTQGGSIGMGTTSPGALLDVWGAGTAGRGVRITETSTSKSNNAYTFTIDSTAHNTNMTAAGAMAVDVNGGRAFTINGLGNVGIGTSTPTTKLHVNGSLTLGSPSTSGGTITPNANGLVLYGDDGDAGLYVYDGYTYFADGSSHVRDTGEAYFATNVRTPILRAHDGGGLRLYDDGGNGIFVQDGGNVGIGTASPITKLEVNGSIRTSNGSGGTLTLFESNATRSNRFLAGADANGAYIDSTYSSGGSADILFKNVGVTNMILKSSGNVGIGTIDPQTILDIGDGNDNNYLRINRNGNSDGGIEWYRPSGGAIDAQIYVDADENLRLSNDFGKNIVLEGGNVGIGTTTPPQKLSVWGNMEIGTGGTSNSIYAYNTSRTAYGQLELYNGSNGNVTLSTNFSSGDVILMPGASGGIGIGTTTPNTKLNILTGSTLNDMQIAFAEDTGNQQSILFSEGNIGYIPYFSIQHDGSGLNPLNLLKIRSDGGTGDGVIDTDVMTFTQAGNVGIGTTSPSSLLELSGTAAVLTLDDSSGSGGYLDFKRNGALGFRLVHEPVSDTIELKPDDERGLTLSGSGKVGIGTTTPTSRLHIETTGSAVANAQLLISGNTSGGSPSLATAIELRSNTNARGRGILMTTSDSTAEWYAGVPYNGGYSIGYDPSTGQSEYTSSSKFFITTGGSVGIGTTTPGASLTITNSDPRIRLQDTDPGGEVWDLQAGVSGLRVLRDGNNDLTINQAGDVGIGTTSPARKLTIADTSNQLFLVDSNSTDSTFTGGTLFSSNDGLFTIQGSQGGGTGSTIRFAIDQTTGNVGIGTTNPQGVLHVTGDTTSSTTLLNLGNRLTVTGDGVLKWGSAATHGYLSWDTARAIIGGQPGNDLSLVSGGTERIRIKETGNVGIGTTTPASRLHLVGTNNVTGGLTIGSNTGTSGDRLAIWGEGNSSAVIQTLVSGGVLGFRNSAGTEVMRIAGNGALAIGTTSPVADLHVYDATGNADIIAERSGGARTTMMSQSTVGWLGTVSNHNLYLGTNSSARLVVTTDGRVGIGTTTPSYKLDIKDSNAVIGLQDTNAGGEQWTMQAGVSGFYISHSGTLTNGIALDAQTNYVGIGTTNPAQKLDVAGSAHVSGNLGIGSSTPSAPLTIVGPSAPIGMYSSVAVMEGSGSMSNQASLEMKALRGSSTANQAFTLQAWKRDQVGTAARSLALNPDGGNVGVGTTTPSAKLEVAGGALQLGNSAASALQFLNASGAFTTTRIYNNASDAFIIQSADDVIAQLGGMTNAQSFEVRDNTNGVKFIVQAAGNVGVGTTSPASLLEVAGSAPTLTLSSTKNGTWTVGEVVAGLDLYSADASSIGSGVKGSVRLVSNDTTGARTDLVFSASSAGTNNREIMRLVGDTGNVGIGTTTPNTLLHVVGTSNQFRVGYDSSDYVTLDVGNEGGTVLTTFGADPDLIFDIGNGDFSIANGGFFYSPTNHRLALNNSGADGLFSIYAPSGTQTNAVPIMTSNTEPSGEATASGGIAYRAFDGNTENCDAACWYPSGVTSGWIAYEFPTPKVITTYVIYGSQSTTRNPTDWTFEAWDGDEWIVLDTRADQSLTASATSYVLSNTTAYAKYRLNITENQGGSPVQIKELQLKEAVSYSVPALQVANNGATGIGTTTPSAQLDVYGIAGSSDIFAISSSTNARLLTVTSAGNVGIGTSTPAATLHVDGTFVLNGNYPIGTNNVALGGLALASTSLSGNANTAVGASALENNSSGAANTALGYRALVTNSSGGSNVALGLDALRFNTSGSFNTVTGLAAMEENTTGARNTANGYLALRFNEVGNDNVGVGYRAAYQTTGSSNIAIGNDALWGNEGGSFNTAVGHAALNVATGGSNTALGFRAGSKITSGTQNIVIGYGGTTGVTTGSNNIIIGQEVRAGLTVTGDNQLNIGNLIFGTGLASSTIYSTGKVGIGMAAPEARLDVSSVGGAVAQFRRVGDDAKIYIRREDTSIGDGNTLGIIAFTGDDASATNTIGASIEARASQNWTSGSTASSLYFSTTPSGSETPLERLALREDGTIRMAINGGNVGIGTASPDQLLKVASSTNATPGTRQTYAFGVAQGIPLAIGGDSTYSYLQSFGGALQINNQGNNTLLNVGGGNVGIGTTSPSAKLDVWGNLNVATGTTSTLFVDTATGRVGIGTSNPNDATLTVGDYNNGSTTGKIRINSATNNVLTIDGDGYNQASNPMRFSVNSVTLLTLSGSNSIFNNGNVGIGTQAPNAKFHINDGGVTITDTVPSSARAIVQGSGNNQLVVLSTDGGQSLVSFGDIDNYNAGAVLYDNSTHALSFRTNDVADRMVISSNGNVGIGTTTPQRILHVVNSADGAPVRFEDANGYCEIDPTSTTWTCTSDERLKEDIRSLDGATVLANLAELRPVSFAWKSDATHAERIGLIAQEVEELFPDLVTSDRTTGYRSVAYGGFTTYLLSGVRELAQERSQIAALLATGTGTFAATSPFSELLETDSIWSRMVELAENFIDGILRVGGIRTDELCVGEVCVDEATFLKMVEESGGSSAPIVEDDENDAGSSAPSSPKETDPAEPMIDEEEDVMDSDAPEVTPEPSEETENEAEPATEDLEESIAPAEESEEKTPLPEEAPKEPDPEPEESSMSSAEDPTPSPASDSAGDTVADPS